MAMTGFELLARAQALVDAGYGEETVFLDTDPHDLHLAGEVDIDVDGMGIIIWKEELE